MFYLTKIIGKFDQNSFSAVDRSILGQPPRGAETKKLRPCVIIQGNLVNHQSKTIIVAPLLPNHKTWPFAVNLEPTDENGLDKARHINLKQLRAVDVSRFGKLQGRLEKTYLAVIKAALVIVFDECFF